jgi:hypothetical protein
MSFAIFRKYEKPIMWATVVFSVLIFATFSGFGSLKNLLSQHATVEVYGQFDVHSSGQRHVTTTSEFMGVRQALSRFAYARNGTSDVKDPEVWSHLILLEEGRGAGLQATDRDVAQFVQQQFGGQPVTADLYTFWWRDRLGFPSARAYEEFIHDFILGNRWAQFDTEAAGVVNADDVYLRWRQDNERFDYDAVVIADLTDEQLGDPSTEDLQKLWDDTPQALRDATYVEPRRLDVAYAWAPLGEGEHAVPAEKLAPLAEPTDEEVQQRFEEIGEERWPDVKEPTDEIKAVLKHELKVASAAQVATKLFEAGEDKSVEAFRRIMEDAGLTFANPEGLLGTDELAKLPDIEDELLPMWLSQQKVGTAYLGEPDTAKQMNVHVVLLEAEQPSRPLTFEEAHDKLVTNWRNGRRSKPAADYREALRKAARELPECQAVIQPLVDAAQKRADDAAAALGADATDEAKAAARKQVLDASERGEIAARVAEFEHLVWDSVPRPEGARVLNFTGVPKSYSRHPTGDEEPTSVERQLKVAQAIFRLGVNGISEPVRHTPSAQTAIALVRARSFPDKAEMLADTAGMETARRMLSSQRFAEAQRSLAPEALMASHNLEVAELAQKKQPGKDGQPPPDF